MVKAEYRSGQSRLAAATFADDGHRLPPPEVEAEPDPSELWGEAQSKYTLTLPSLQSQKSFNTTLVARFDVSSAGSITLGTLTSKFVPPWETTAYNPAELTQTTALSETITVTANTGQEIAISSRRSSSPTMYSGMADAIRHAKAICLLIMTKALK